MILFKLHYYKIFNRVILYICIKNLLTYRSRINNFIVIIIKKNIKNSLEETQLLIISLAYHIDRYSTLPVT